MTTETSNSIIAVLGALVFALLIAVIAILTFDKSAQADFEYTLGDNEAGIENAADYGLRQAPEVAIVAFD